MVAGWRKQKRGKTLNSSPSKILTTLNSLELLAILDTFFWYVRKRIIIFAGFNGKVNSDLVSYFAAGNKKNPEQSVFIRVQGFCMSLFGATRPVFVPIGKSFPCYFVRLGVGSLPRSQSFHPFQKHSVGYPSFPATYNLH